MDAHTGTPPSKGPDRPTVVTEELEAGPVPMVVHPGWAERFPWLCQGTTARGRGEPFDLGLFGAAPTGRVQDRWRTLATATGFPRVVHARQVHGVRVVHHRESSAGRAIFGDADGHVTGAPGVLLTVSTADCVPVFLIAERTRVVSLVHAGWRGTAAGALERGLDALRAWDVTVEDVHVHLGPAICGDCYEVGPEVHRALGLVEPPRPEPIDLRGVLARRAMDAGIEAHRVSVSSHCTRCGDRLFFSHRAGDRERQLGVLGLRPESA